MIPPGALALVPALGPWFGAGVLVAILLSSWKPFQKMKVDRDVTLVATLIARVEKLETDLTAVTRSLEDKLERERAAHDSLIGMMRHRLNNVQACLDALLMLLKHDPSRAAEAVALIEDMRTRQTLYEAQEAAAIAAARIIVAGPCEATNA